jgi:hypothetical protein
VACISRGFRGLWPVFHKGFKQVHGPYFKRVRHLFFMGIQGSPWPVFHGGLGVCGPYLMGGSRGYMALFHGVSRGPWPVFHEGFKRVRGPYFKGVRHQFFKGLCGPYCKGGLAICGLYFMWNSRG